jgi:hypothetical protein
MKMVIIYESLQETNNSLNETSNPLNETSLKKSSKRTGCIIDLNYKILMG